VDSGHVVQTETQKNSANGKVQGNKETKQGKKGTEQGKKGTENREKGMERVKKGKEQQKKRTDKPHSPETQSQHSDDSSSSGVNLDDVTNTITTYGIYEDTGLSFGLGNDDWKKCHKGNGRLSSEEWKRTVGAKLADLGLIQGDLKVKNTQSAIKVDQKGHYLFSSHVYPDQQRNKMFSLKVRASESKAHVRVYRRGTEDRAEEKEKALTYEFGILIPVEEFETLFVNTEMDKEKWRNCVKEKFQIQDKSHHIPTFENSIIGGPIIYGQNASFKTTMKCSHENCKTFTLTVTVQSKAAAITVYSNGVTRHDLPKACRLANDER
jgi:hypothetical protein